MEIKLGKAFEEMLARVGDPGGTQLIAGELVVSRVSGAVSERQVKRSTAKKVVAKTARSPHAKKSTSRRRGPSTP